MLRLIPSSCLLLVLLALSTPIQAEEGFQSIFDGATLNNWDGNPKFWLVEDGAIVGQTTSDNPTKGNTFLVWRGGELKNFELRVKYRIDGGNSGIQYRSKEAARWVVGGYQGDIDAGNTYTGILYEERGRGILGRRGKQVIVGENGKPKDVGEIASDESILSAIKAGQWNDYTIVARGNHLQHFINGQQTLDLVDNHEEGRSMCGLLALQLHAGPPMKIEFKDIQLKHLPFEDAAASSGSTQD